MSNIEFKSKNIGIETKLIHAGEPKPRIDGSVIMPIFQTAMFENTDSTEYHAVRYVRLNNFPNHIALNSKLAQLEGTEDALVCGSGMAAITSALLASLNAGDHLLIQESLYGGTHDFLTNDLVNLGIKFDFIDPDKPSSWEAKCKPNTKVIYVETISNPLLKIPDLKAIVAFAKANNLISMIDNTFASPINFRPFELGFGLSLHSCTKFLNGHSDIAAGACLGSKAQIEKINHKLSHFGGMLDPHAAFLLHRGMKTLALRVRYQNDSALQIAQFLEKHPSIAKVNYPGLESHPQHARAKALFAGFGGVISFELKGGLPAAKKFIDKVNLATHAVSLGGIETLITCPALTTHAGLSDEDKKRSGITDGLARLSIGIETTSDLIADFEQALQ
jgi:cystathionine beta-lyase/cystathionine gamma-synthase